VPLLTLLPKLIELISNEVGGGPMPFRMILLTALALTCLVGAQSTNYACAADKSTARIAKALDAWASKYKVVDASVVVVRAGKVVALHSIGSYEPGMLVPVASLSKAITGVCIAKLVQAGKIAFEDQLGSLLKEHFRIRPPRDPRASNITIGQLLTHKSGLSLDPTQGGLGQFWPYTVSSTERQVDVALSFDLTPDAGRKFSYNNVNYSALGLVIETVTGEAYEDYCFREVLAPVGIQNAKLNPDWMVMGAAGGWLISTTDYAKFLAYFDSGSSALTLRTAKWPKADRGNGVYYGIGVVLRKAGKGYDFWHRGSWSIAKPFASFGAYFASWYQQATVVVTFRPTVADEAMGELDRKLYAATSR